MLQLPLMVLNNWKVIAASAATAVIVGMAGMGLHGCSVDRLETKHKAAMEAAAAQCTADKDGLKATCLQDKQLTTEASNAYQTNIADLNRQLANLKRVRQQTTGANACVPIAGPAGGFDGGASGAKYAQPHGVDANALYDYAAECEQYRLQLKGLQTFNRDTWKAKGQ